MFLNYGGEKTPTQRTCKHRMDLGTTWDWMPFITVIALGSCKIYLWPALLLKCIQALALLLVSAIATNIRQISRYATYVQQISRRCPWWNQTYWIRSDNFLIYMGKTKMHLFNTVMRSIATKEAIFVLFSVCCMFCFLWTSKEPACLAEQTASLTDWLMDGPMDWSSEGCHSQWWSDG